MINAAIPLQVRRPRKVNAMAEAMQALQMRNAAQQMKANQAKIARHTAYREALADSDGSVEGLTNVAAKFGDIDALVKLTKHGSDVLAAQRAQQKHDAEMALEKTKLYGQWLGAVTNADSWKAFHDRVAEFSPEDADRLPAKYDPAYVKQLRMEGLTTQQQLQHRLDLDKFAETKRSNQAQESAARTRAAAARAAATSKQVTDTANREEKLRNEYSKQAGDFIKIRNAYSRIGASVSEPDHTGDLALVFNFMKMLDPGSTVMQSEQASARNAGNVPRRIRATYNNLFGGGMLSDEQRKDFRDRAKKLFERQNAYHQRRVKTYTDLAKKNRVNPANVVIDLSLIEPPGDQGNTGPIDYESLK